MIVWGRGARESRLLTGGGGQEEEWKATEHRGFEALGRSITDSSKLKLKQEGLHTFLAGEGMSEVGRGDQTTGQQVAEDSGS